ncbi:MAG TPA: efflux RND transporter periplasmic adaptor subunit [Blastocatellia bacterium]|nr:efflux RND transporter periplasmic adaptor subunit [Blastocatellia bacterium]
MKVGSFRKTLLIGAIILAIAGAAAAWKYFSGRASSDRIVLSGTIEADEIHVGSKVSGRIAEVLVKEGQEVRQGQPIIRFESYDLDAKRADAVAAVAEAEANLEKMEHWSRPEELAEARAQAEAAWMNLELARNGPRPQEIEAARADVQAANADYEVAKATLARVQELTRSGVQSRQDYDNAKAAFDRAVARRKSAQEKLDLLLAGTRKEEIARAERQYRQAAANLELVQRGARREDIEAARAQLDRARAALQQIETQMGELEVKAPADAYVEVLQVRPGDLINPNSPVATLVEVDRLWVRVYVPEPELGHVQLGKEVSVTVDTFGKESFKGTIEQIASKGEFTPRNVQTRDERTHQVFAVRVRLDNTSRRLRAGMAADVAIVK